MLRKCIPILAVMLLLLTSCGGNNRSESNGPDFNRSFAHAGSYVCSTEDTIFYAYGQGIGSTDRFLLRYTDKATGIGGPLCGKPECTHDSSGCNAYFYGRIALGLNNYDGRLYWVGRDAGSPGLQVTSEAYDGTDRRIVRSLDIENVPYNSSSGAQLHRGWLFLGGTGAGIKNGEVFRTTRVFAVPLDPDEEPIEILSIKDGGSVIYQPYGDSLYIATDDKMSDDNYGMILYRWDMLTGELETLYRGATPFGGVREFWVTDDGILLHTPFKIETDEEGIFYNRSIYKFDFASGEIDLLYEFISIEGKFAVCAADGMFVGNNVTDDGELVLLVKDFNGNVILDETLEGVDWLEVNTPMMFCGVDDDYFYFYSTSIGRDEHLVAVPRTGGSFQILWPTE